MRRAELARMMPVMAPALMLTVVMATMLIGRHASAQGSITSQPLAPPPGITTAPTAPFVRPTPLAAPTAPVAPLTTLPKPPSLPVAPTATIPARPAPPMLSAPSSIPAALPSFSPTGTGPGGRVPSLLGRSAPGQASIAPPAASQAAIPRAPVEQNRSSRAAAPQVQPQTRFQPQVAPPTPPGAPNRSLPPRSLPSATSRPLTPPAVGQTLAPP